MADLSVAFNPSDISSTIATDSATWDKGSHASSVAHKASSRIAESSAGWDTGAAAGAKAASNSSRIAESSANWNKASDASSAASEALSRITARSAVWDKKTVCIKAKDDASAVADGDGARWIVPNALSGMDLVSCGAHVYTAPTSTIMQLKISNVTSAVQMLTSNMTIDVNEKDTNTAVSQAVINTATDGVAATEELRFYASEAGSGAKGLEFRATFKKA